jgi:hypothetical protein
VNFKPTSELLEWLDHPQTEEVWKGLEQSKDQALNDLRIACSRTTDPAVMKAYQRFDVIETFQKAIKAMKEKQRAQASDTSAT